MQPSLHQTSNGHCMVEDHKLACYSQPCVNHNTTSLMNFDWSELVKTLFFISIITLESTLWMMNYFKMSDESMDIKYVKQCIVLFSLLPYLINALYFLFHYCSCSDNESNHSCCLSLSYPIPILM